MNSIQKIKLFFLVFFLTSVTLINFWNKLKLSTTFPNSGINQLCNLISYNFMIDEYSFFSPDIADAYDISFLIESKETGKLEKKSINLYNKEIVNKIFSVNHKFYSYNVLRDYISYSFANYYFNLNPKDSKVIFAFSLYKLPNSTDYKKGAKPHLELIYAREYFNK